jgi:hypothetical protein
VIYWVPSILVRHTLYQVTLCNLNHTDGGFSPYAPSVQLYVRQLSLLLARAQEDFREMSNGGFAGERRSTGVLSVPSPPSGCASSNYSSSAQGAIAVVERGGCSFYDKCLAAQRAGAVGCVVFNWEDESGVLNGQLGPAGALPLPLPHGTARHGMARHGTKALATRRSPAHSAWHRG